MGKENEIVLSYCQYLESARGLLGKLKNCAPNVSRNQFQDLFRLYTEKHKDEFSKNLDSVIDRIPADRSFTHMAMIAYFHDISRAILPEYYSVTSQLVVDDWLASIDFRKFNRDHVIHQYMTTYIIDRLLRSNMFRIVALKECRTYDNENNHDTLIDHVALSIAEDKLPCSEFLKKRYLDFLEKHSVIKPDNQIRSIFAWKNIIERAALIAGMFHDIGYPFQFANRIQSPLNPLIAHDDVEQDIKRELFEKHYQRMFMLPFRNFVYHPIRRSDKEFSLFCKAFDNTHSLFSVMVLLDMHDKYVDAFEPDPEFTLALEWAALAMLRHDLSRIYARYDKRLVLLEPELRINFSQDPLSALLALSDNLQEFERYNAEIKPHPKRKSDFECNPECEILESNLFIYYSKSCQEVRLNHEPGKDLKITYCMTDRTSYIRKLLELEEMYEIYYHPNYGYIDLSGMGIRNVILNAKLLEQ